MKLSIITINYNNKLGLQKTIDSVITQTFKDYEWIIIDGGSTDGSKELIEEYSQYITYWVSEPDKGIYNAMNKGILKAKGEYLQFLNSGDIYYNNKVLSLIFKNNNDSDIITGSIFCDNKVLRGIGSKEISLNDFFYNSVFHPSSFIKKELFDKYGLYDENYKIASDWKFFLITIIIKVSSVSYIDKPLIIFDSSGISSTNITLVKYEKEKILNELFSPLILRDYTFLRNEFLVMNNFLTKRIYTIMVKFLRFYHKNK